MAREVVGVVSGLAEPFSCRVDGEVEELDAGTEVGGDSVLFYC